MNTMLQDPLVAVGQYWSDVKSKLRCKIEYDNREKLTCRLNGLTDFSRSESVESCEKRSRRI